VTAGDRPVRIASRRVSRKAAFVGAAALVIAVSATSGAQAQNCTPFVSPFGFDLSPLYTAGLSAAIAVGSAITAANTAFLTQSTAFVSAPGNPKPDSEGSGIWVRGVGGEATIKTNASINASLGFVGGGTPTNGMQLKIPSGIWGIPVRP
jgi:hypothetical protein